VVFFSNSRELQLDRVSCIFVVEILIFSLASRIQLYGLSGSSRIQDVGESRFSISYIIQYEMKHLYISHFYRLRIF